MMINSNKQLSVKLLIMLLISSLLFITSIKLHIHTKDAMALVDHGSAVSITAVVADPLSSETNTEININPEGVVKVNQSVIHILSIIFLVIFIGIVLIHIGNFRFRHNHSLHPKPLFYGPPLLRAPPL